MESKNVSSVGKKPGGKLIFTGIIVWLGLELIVNSCRVIFDYARELDFPIGIVANILNIISYLSCVGLILFWIGVEISVSYQRPYGLKGNWWVRIGLFFLLIWILWWFLGHQLFGLGDFMYENRPWSLVISNCSRMIFYALCAIGFMQFGTSGKSGFVGKSGGMLLAGAFWFKAGVFAYFIAVNLGASYCSWLDNVVNVLCLVLVWIGWKRLLCAWYDGKSVMEKPLWKVYAGAVLNGLVLLTLASFAGMLFDVIGMANDKVDLARSFMSGDLRDFFTPDGWDVASWLALGLEIMGYVMYFGGLKQFSTLQGSLDAAAILKVRSGAMLTLAGIICGHIPVIGWLVKLVFVVVGFLKMLGGYKSLKYSETFAGYSGAGTLHSALIVQLVGVLVGLLPFIGFIECICDVIVFFMIINGWLAIKNADLSGHPQMGRVDSGLQKVKRMERMDEKQKEYAGAFLQKSDEELKELIREEGMYTPAFIAAVREELQARILGQNCRREMGAAVPEGE